MQRLFNKILPFILMGIAVVAFAFGIIILAYLFFFGAVLGLILYLIVWVRNKFFPPKNITKRTKKVGRIIDSDDWKDIS